METNASSIKKVADLVASHVGAWIETKTPQGQIKWMNVASHVGAWIETIISRLLVLQNPVASHVGAWIETLRRTY